MTRALAACLLLAACYSAAPPTSSPAPAASPPPRTAPRAATADEEALCCCTFDFAGPADFGDGIRTWESLASRCPKGGAGRHPGQCIAWSFCGYAPGAEPKSLAERPDLRPPPPLGPDECCCDVFANGAEDIAVRSRAECSAAGAHCVVADFCGRDEP